MSKPSKDQEEIKAKIIARAWKDPAFKRKLLSDPHSVLKEMGCPIPANIKIHVVEDTNNSFTFVLPPTPSSIKNLSETDLQRLAAGGASVRPCDVGTRDTNEYIRC